MSRSSQLARLCGIAGVLALVGWIDYVTGYELQFFLFYFVPVALAAWYTGRTLGIVVALLSATTWFYVDLLSGHPYSHPIYFYWNTTIRLAAFLAIGLALSQVRTMLDAETRLRHEVQKAMGEVKQLRGMLPICAWCKKIRNDAGLWEQVELYVRSHSEAEFTHGLCPDCYSQLHERR
jgi:hypothetical protein